MSGRRALHVVLGLVLLVAAGLYAVLVRAPGRPDRVWVRARAGDGERWLLYGNLARLAPGGAAVRGYTLSFVRGEAEDVVFLTEQASALTTLLDLLRGSPASHAYTRAGPPDTRGEGDTWLPFEARTDDLGASPGR